MLVPALLLILVPVALVLVQPDLGTAVTLLVGGAAMLFMAGVRLWKFAAVGALGAAALPVLWANLHDYQRQRIFTFLDPEADPLGAGYHIIQSKIALGSGGLWGKGFLHGTQASSASCRRSRPISPSPCWPRSWASSARLGARAVPGRDPPGPRDRRARAQPVRAGCWRSGSVLNLFIYVVINISMVTGLIPVVGVPAAADLLWRHRHADPGRRAWACCCASTSTATLAIPRFPVEPLTGPGVFTARPIGLSGQQSTSGRAAWRRERRTGGRILVDQLRVQGVDTVFCVPGESYLEVLDALHDTPEIRFVVCRQEGGAAMMAEA